MVAPIHLSSPLAKAGLSILAASTAPSAAPAPTSVWISSIKRTTSPSAFFTSFSTAFKRSSNSPLYFAPATIAPISKTISLLSFNVSGTVPSTILCAKPSTIAVLPTPGSPIKTGLFFVLLDKTCITLVISSSLPITGSSFPICACSVRSCPNLNRASYLFSGSGSVILWLPLIF